MKDSTRNLSAAAALAAIGVASVAVSCTGPKATKAQPGSKTTGPAIAKGDKTTAKPSVTAKKPATAAKKPAVTAKKPPVAKKPPIAKSPAKKPPVAKKPTVPAKKPPVAKKPAKKPAVAKKPATTGSTAGGRPVPPPKPGAPLPPPAPPRPVKKAPAAKKPAVTPKTPTPTVKKPAPTVKKPTTKPTKKPTPTVKKPAPTVKKPTTPGGKKPTTTPGGKKPGIVKKPAVAKTPQAEADQILEARLRELQIEREKNKLLVEDYLEHARAAAKNFDHDATSEWATKALQLDHNNKEAERLLREALEAKGDREASIANLSDLLVAQAQVKKEQARFSAQQYWSTAMRAKQDGDYQTALDNLESALSVVQYDPSGVNWGSMKRDIKSEMEAVRQLKESADKSAKAEAARQAYRMVKEEEAAKRMAQSEKKNKMFRAAIDAFEHERYQRAETLLREYLQVAPDDVNAKQLLYVANRAKHKRASSDTLQLQRERIKEWRLNMEETTTPYHKILTWPSQAHWNRITELRKDAGLISAVESETPETVATRNKLRSERISFDYQGADFTTVIEYIKTARGINLLIDSQIQSELEAVPITLKLTDVTVEDALNTLGSVAGGLTYTVEGSIVLITRPEFARKAPVVQVHSIGDLTVQLTNFIGPNLNLLPSSAEEDEEQPRFGGASEGVAPFGGAEDLVTLITANVADEDYWSSDGVSLAPSGEDKLVVVAEPGIQRDVANFLNDLRAFSGLVVTIETRFLTVTDNFLRDVGVDIRGLGGGTPGPIALLDDVTNGLDDNASAGRDNGGVGLPANGSSSPSSGAFFNDNSDGDYRARTENVFDRQMGRNITNTGGAAVQWTFLDDTFLSVILRAVEKTQEGRVLQAPSVTVFNTQRANITLINQLTFIQDFDVEVAQTAFIADPIIGIIQDGLVLDVQPTVSHDRRYITLQLQPTIANLTRPIPTFTTSLGAFTTPVTIQVPELEVQRAQTTVRVPDGGTLLLGGLKSINIADLKAETPFFNNLPFASFFMGRRGSVKEMSNLMIIVKSTISDLHEQEGRFRR